MKHDPSIAIIKPGPHRQKRVRKALEDPTKRAVVVLIDQGPGGPLHVPPAVKVHL